MDIRFDGKRALVTGAGKGIGKCVAIRLAECGAEVIAVSRTRSDLYDLIGSHPDIIPLVLDIGDWKTTKIEIQRVGPIDLLVNNAAIYFETPIGDISEEDIEKLFKVNVNAVINISQEVFKGMKGRNSGGAIVNVSSIIALRSVPAFTPYAATKAALDQLTRNMACEFGPYNVRVNSVSPTAIRTRMAEAFFDPKNEFGKAMKEKTPLRRLGEPDDVAYPILFLLSDKASMITGVTLPVDGGLTICL